MHRGDTVWELGWSESLGHMKGDNSVEFLPMQELNNGDWEIQKTADIMTGHEKEHMYMQGLMKNSQR